MHQSKVLGLVPLVASQHCKVSVVLQMKKPGPKEGSDLPKVMQKTGGEAGAYAPTDRPSWKPCDSHEKEAVPAFLKLPR